MASPARTRLRAGPTTPRSTRNRRSQPPDAELPVLDTAQNRLYGSSIPVLPDDSETGSRLAHGSLARNMARTRRATSVRSVRSEQVAQDRDRDERSNRELIREGSVTSRGKLELPTSIMLPIAARMYQIILTSEFSLQLPRPALVGGGRKSNLYLLLVC